MKGSPERALERVTKATKEVAKAVFTTHVGRFLLASATLVSATAMVAENVTSADEAAKSCLDFRYNPNVLVRGASFEDSSSVRLEVIVNEACRANPNNPNARLVKVEADLAWPFTNKKQANADKSLHSPVTIPLYDDGTNGDLVAGDNKYTAELYFDSTAPLEVEGIKGVSAQSPFPSMGITTTYTDNAKKTNGKSPDLYVVDKGIIPAGFKVEQRGDGIQASEHVINIRDDAATTSHLLATESLGSSMTVLVNKVYKDVVGGSDPWHFLQFSSDNRKLLTPDNLEYEELGVSTRTDYIGTGGGGDGIQQSERYGSKGELRHMIFTANPIKLHSFLNGFTHWGAGLNLPASLGLTDQSVWKGKMLPGGLLGGIPVEGLGDGTFKVLGGVRSVPKMNPLEKYLFGFIPKEQVSPAYIASRAGNCFERDCVISKFDKKVTIDEIIASLEGVVRTPGPGDPNLLKDFKAGHIYTTTGRMATREEMYVQDIITKQRAEAWKNATDGLSTMQFVVPEAVSVDQKPEAPELINRYNGRTLPDMTSGVSINFKPTDKMKWMQYQLIPANDDGPGVNMLIGDPAMIAKGAYKVEAPKDNEGPYILLPGQGYTERVRSSSNVKQPDPNKDADWSPWVTDTLRTPNPGSEAVKLVEPSTGITTQSLNPNIRWVNQPGFFYYELQVSEDPNFETDPSKAIAAVYWNIVHGGISHNTWEPPKGALKPGVRYNVRIRTRVQGDGKEVAWSQPIIFSTSGSAKFNENRRQSSWKPDAVYPDGAIGPSAEDMAQFGR